MNKADWLNDSLLQLEFVSAGNSYSIEDNYIIRTVIPTKRLNVLLKLFEETFFIECKGDIQDVRRLHKAVSAIIDISVEPLEFSNLEIASLKKELNAKKKSATHKMTHGDFDTVAISSAPSVDDLDNSSQYSHSYGQNELREIKCQFSYINFDDKQLEVTIQISSKGSIWFLSEVPEEVINYVFSIVRKVKPICSI